MRIIGIDPGYAIMGWGILDYNGNSFKTVEYGSLKTDADMDMPYRLGVLYDELSQLIDKYEPQEAAVEQLFFNNNAKTVIRVGEARGVAILACVQRGLDVFEYTPLQIKQSLVGYGRAEKKQVQSMVKMILNLTEVPKPDDTADAVAAAICHAHSRSNGMRRKIINRGIR